MRKLQKEQWRLQLSNIEIELAVIDPEQVTAIELEFEEEIEDEFSNV